VGKRFDLFMKNPWWKKLYDEAPSDELREHLRRSFENSAIKYDRPVQLTKQDYQYLYDHAEGGYYRTFLKRKIAGFDNQDQKPAEKKEEQNDEKE